MAKLRQSEQPPPPQTRAARIMDVDDDEETAAIESSSSSPQPRFEQPAPQIVASEEPVVVPKGLAADKPKPILKRPAPSKLEPRPLVTDSDQRAPGTQAKPYEKRDGGKMVKWSIHAPDSFVREYKEFAARELYGAKANEWAVGVLRNAMRGFRGGGR